MTDHMTTYSVNIKVRGAAANLRAVQALCGLDAVPSISCLHPLCQTRIPYLPILSSQTARTVCAVQNFAWAFTFNPAIHSGCVALPPPVVPADRLTAPALPLWQMPVARKLCSRARGRGARKCTAGCAASHCSAACVCVARNQCADQTRSLEVQYPVTALAGACSQEALRRARSRGATKCAAAYAASHCSAAYVSGAFVHCAERIFRVHHPGCALADAMPMGELLKSVRAAAAVPTARQPGRHFACRALSRADILLY